MSEARTAPALDPELRAMNEVVTALSSLSAEEVRRVLAYVIQRLQPALAPSVGVAPSGSGPTLAGTGGFEDIPSLFDAAHPQSGTDKALVVGYFHQAVQGEEDFDSYSINTELKNLGHPSKNITRDLEGLINRRLVMQTRKEGKSRQARKRYKLTREGIKLVDRMLAGEPRSEADD